MSNRDFWLLKAVDDISKGKIELYPKTALPVFWFHHIITGGFLCECMRNKLR